MRPAQADLVATDVTIEYTRRGVRTTALQGLDLKIEQGEFVSIVGPSGCGKSTFLMAADGLVPITTGTIAVGGQTVTGPAPNRSVVFQDASLLPWRTVRNNILYGMQLRRPRDRANEAAVAEALIATVGLTEFESSYPYQLSGGMQQRVNLARALAVDPQILLLDEPFAALDAQTRETMQSELLNVWEQFQKTALFVTHQIDEAIYLSDRLLVFSRRPGRVIADIRIDFARPRKLALKREPSFGALEQEVWELIQDQHPGPNEPAGFTA